MNLKKAKEKAISLLAQLPESLAYHNLDHTRRVVKAAGRIADAIEISAHERLLLETAAWFHDIGFRICYSHNEPFAADIVKDLLPDFDYTPNDIEAIAAMIMATATPRTPHTLLEKIMCDADLDYLGNPKEDFEIISAHLRAEMETYGTSYSDEQWKTVQIKFLKEHIYFTDYAKEHRQPTLELRLTKIKNHEN